MLVRISETGQSILDNKELANQILSAIIAGKDNFTHGKPIFVEGSIYSVEMVTSIEEDCSSKCTESKESYK